MNKQTPRPAEGDTLYRDLHSVMEGVIPRHPPSGDPRRFFESVARDLGVWMLMRELAEQREPTLRAAGETLLAERLRLLDLIEEATHRTDFAEGHYAQVASRLATLASQGEPVFVGAMAVLPKKLLHAMPDIAHSDEAGA